MACNYLKYDVDHRIILFHTQNIYKVTTEWHSFISLINFIAKSSDNIPVSLLRGRQILATVRHFLSSLSSRQISLSDRQL